MKILHYSLGLPPYRSGGLTKYCCDLMESQVSRGHEVALVWPGSMFGHFSFKKRRDWQGIANYEILDPLPVPYDEGIIDVEPYLEVRSKNVCESFLRALAPDVLHVHSFMGLPSELVDAAVSLGVRTVFTTHDYFPLCPRVTLFRDGSVCDISSKCGECPACNAGGLPLSKIRLLQSPLYRAIKDFAPVKMLRARHRVQNGALKAGPIRKAVCQAEDYMRLRARNVSILEKIDVIHANSTLTANVYRKILPVADIRVVSIGNAETRALHSYDDWMVGNPVRLGYFGAANAPKGYHLLLDALDILWAEGLRFQLNVYGPFEASRPYVRVHPRYNYTEIDFVFQATDLAVVPSLWPETYGFQATEALCRGVPVAVSSMVGMQDVLGEDMGVVFDPTSRACAAALKVCLNPVRLAEMRRAISEGFVPPQIEDVETLYERSWK